MDDGGGRFNDCRVTDLFQWNSSGISITTPGAHQTAVNLGILKDH